MNTKTEGSAALKVIEQHESQLTQETERANKALAKLHERGAVKDQEHADWIGRALVKAKENARGWKNIREEATRPLYQVWKSQVAKFQKPEDAYKQFISEASKLLGTWNAESCERCGSIWNVSFYSDDTGGPNFSQCRKCSELASEISYAESEMLRWTCILRLLSNEMVRRENKGRTRKK